MDKTKIDWCDSSWNPVTGCLHKCEYCYARGIAHRFGGASESHNGEYGMECLWDVGGNGVCHSLDKPLYDPDREHNAPYPYEFDPTFHRYRLGDYRNKKGRNIFVCSMADLFGEWIPDSWIEEVFAACEAAPQHNYLFLTKNPARYAELVARGLLPKKDNMWYGFSCTRPGYTGWFNKGFHTFVSIEPLLEPLKNVPLMVDWVIVGAETGRRKDKVVPSREWIEDIVKQCAVFHIPLFMKSSLSEIWGEPLIREFPEQLRRSEI